MASITPKQIKYVLRLVCPRIAGTSGGLTGDRQDFDLIQGCSLKSKTYYSKANFMNAHTHSYTRVSSRQSAEEYSRCIERQKEAIRVMYRKSGTKIIGEFEARNILSHKILLSQTKGGNNEHRVN